MNSPIRDNSVVLVTCALLAACGTDSAQPDRPVPAHVYVNSVVPYENADVGSVAVQRECHWNRELPVKLAEDSNGVVVVDDVAFANPALRRLSLVAVNVHSLGGAAVTGPKWAYVQGRLTDNGKLIGSFEISDRSIHGSLTACGTLSSLGDNIANDIASWLKTPTIDPNVR